MFIDSSSYDSANVGTLFDGISIDQEAMHPGSNEVAAWVQAKGRASLADGQFSYSDLKDLIFFIDSLLANPDIDPATRANLTQLMTELKATYSVWTYKLNNAQSPFRIDSVNQFYSLQALGSLAKFDSSGAIKNYVDANSRLATLAYETSALIETGLQGVGIDFKSNAIEILRRLDALSSEVSGIDLSAYGLDGLRSNLRAILSADDSARFAVMSNTSISPDERQNQLRKLDLKLKQEVSQAVVNQLQTSGALSTNPLLQRMHEAATNTNALFDKLKNKTWSPSDFAITVSYTRDGLQQTIRLLQDQLQLAKLAGDPLAVNHIGNLIKLCESELATFDSPRSTVQLALAELNFALIRVNLDFATVSGLYTRAMFQYENATGEERKNLEGLVSGYRLERDELSKVREKLLDAIKKLGEGTADAYSRAFS